MNLIMRRYTAERLLEAIGDFERATMPEWGKREVRPARQDGLFPESAAMNTRKAIAGTPWVVNLLENQVGQ